MNLRTLKCMGNSHKKSHTKYQQRMKSLFLNAAKLTGVALSELDSCQQRVVLKLNTDCHRMNDEQLAKMAVHLLNCQSYVEGRTMYTCTDEMTIKDCTKSMDSDTWTSYHLMTNRARAVCYAIRQTQFRGMAEYTVNRLMEAAKQQLATLDRIAEGQDGLQIAAKHTFGTLNQLSQAHQDLSEQQKDLQRAQLHGQLELEDNIRRLVDEKRLIADTHNQLVQMTKEVQTKLRHSSDFLVDHTTESRANHARLLEDLLSIQEKTQDIFDKIEDSARLLMKQNQDFAQQYASTLRNLQEVNSTVHTLMIMIGGTRHALEERLTWIMTALGGTDSAVERLYLVLWHVGFMLVAMLCCAFLSARTTTRFVVAILPPMNLAVALHGQHDCLDPVAMGGAIVAFVLVQNLTLWTLQLHSKLRKTQLPSIKDKSPIKRTLEVSSTRYDSDRSYTSAVNNSKYFEEHEPIEAEYANNEIEEEELDEPLGSLTPPESRNGYYTANNTLNNRVSRSRSNTPSLRINVLSKKGVCHAKTRVGTPCKLAAMVGRDFCYRHQSGDSVMG